MRKLSTFLSAPVRENGRLAEAVFILLFVRLLFGMLPFSMAVSAIQIKSGNPKWGDVSPTAADNVGRAIIRAARHVPFRAACLQQSFAALLMLRRRRMAATVHLGVRRRGNPNALMAHAWCLSGEVPVVGASDARSFVSIAAFAG